MVYKNKLILNGEDKRPVLEIELGVFKIDKMDELKDFILGLKEGTLLSEVKKGLNDIYAESDGTNFSSFDGVRATLQADKTSDPKLGNTNNEKLDTQATEIEAMQEHLSVIQFGVAEDKPSIKLKAIVKDGKRDESVKNVDDKEEVKPSTAEDKDPKEGIAKSLFLNDSPVSDTFKELHGKNFGKQEETLSEEKKEEKREIEEEDKDKKETDGKIKNNDKP